LLKAKDSFGEVSATEDLLRFFLQGLTRGVQVTASLVSRSGQLIDSEGTSKEISWPEDKLLLSALRRNAEVVLTTGKTARAENIRMPKTAKLAVISNSGDLSGTRLEATNPDLLMLSGSVDSSEYIEHLESLGFRRLHVEYGPSTLKQSLGSGLIGVVVESYIDTSYFPDNLHKEILSMKLGPGHLRVLVVGVATD
jgi:riboflavin biosynthesis pyrimidine reductase